MIKSQKQMPAARHGHDLAAALALAIFTSGLGAAGHDNDNRSPVRPHRMQTAAPALVTSTKCCRFTTPPYLL